MTPKTSSSFGIFSGDSFPSPLPTEPRNFPLVSGVDTSYPPSFPPPPTPSGLVRPPQRFRLLTSYPVLGAQQPLLMRFSLSSPSSAPPVALFRLLMTKAPYPSPQQLSFSYIPDFLPFRLSRSFAKTLPEMRTKGSIDESSRCSSRLRWTINFPTYCVKTRIIKYPNPYKPISFRASIQAGPALFNPESG